MRERSSDRRKCKRSPEREKEKEGCVRRSQSPPQGKKEKEKRAHSDSSGHKRGSRKKRSRSPSRSKRRRSRSPSRHRKRSKSSRSSSSSRSAFHFASSGSGRYTRNRLLRFAQKHPGRLAAKLLQKMEDRVGRDGEAASWLPDAMPASAKSYFLRVLKPNLPPGSAVRSLREMRTLSVVLDHLALGRKKEAMDTLGQRLKALELASLHGNWERAQHVELVQQENLSLADKEEVIHADSAALVERKLAGRSSSSAYESSWGGSGKGKGKEWQTGKSSPWESKGSKEFKGKKGGKGKKDGKGQESEQQWGRW